MIALDLDGTLLDYAPEGPRSRINLRVLTDLCVRRVRHVAICTNQGGLPWWAMGVTRRDGRPYPSPDQFLFRLAVAVGWLDQYGIAVSAVRVCVFHPKAPDAAIQRAARLVRAGMRSTLVSDWHIYTRADARKPAPLMLRSVGAAEYWGDSDEDEGAALAASVPFVRVARFV